MTGPIECAQSHLLVGLCTQPLMLLSSVRSRIFLQIKPLRKQPYVLKTTLNKTQSIHDNMNSCLHLCLTNITITNDHVKQSLSPVNYFLGT
jgi:hypothetical protein